MRLALSLLALALTGQAGAAGVESWPSQDLDQGRIYAAPDGATVLVSRPYAYAPPLGDWLEPRIVALAGEGVTLERRKLKRLGDAALTEELAARLENGAVIPLAVTAYATPAGHELLVAIRPSAATEAYIAAHVKAGDVWIGDHWEAAVPVTPMDTNGLECRPEQVPSVVWVLDSVYSGETCNLTPKSDMILIEQDVCREPR